MLFALAIWVAVGPIANYLGFDFVIPEKETPPPAVEYTQKPKNTWEPERDTPEPTEEPTKAPTKTPTPHEEGDPQLLHGRAVKKIPPMGEIVENGGEGLGGHGDVAVAIQNTDGPHEEEGVNAHEPTVARRCGEPREFFAELGIQRLQLSGDQNDHAVEKPPQD